MPWKTFFENLAGQDSCSHHLGNSGGPDSYCGQPVGPVRLSKALDSTALK